MARISEPIFPPRDTPEPTQNLGSIKIASINSNSLVSHSKRFELLNFIEKHDIDIALVSETKLNHRHNLEFANYKMVRNDRTASSKGGGTAILVRNVIPFELVYTPSSANNKILEYSIIKIKTASSFLLIIALYANNEVSHLFTDELDDLFVKLNLHAANNFYVIAGDFNARHTDWGDSVNKGKGILLRRWLDDAGLSFRATIIPPVAPTFPSANSFLDLCLIDSRITVTDLVLGKLPVVEYPSDHNALVFTVSLESAINTRDPTPTHRFMFKKTRWLKFIRTLSSHYNHSVPDDRNLSNEEITDHLIKIQKFLCTEISHNVPRYKPTNKVLNYVNRRIRSLHRDKSLLISTLNRLLRANSRSPWVASRISHVRTLLGEINAELKAEYALSANKYWDTLVRSIDYRKPLSFFPRINSFFRPKTRLNIESLEFGATDREILDRANIDTSNSTERDDQITVTSPIKVLDSMGAFFETINAPRHTNTGTPLQIEVDTRIAALVAKFHDDIATGKTITDFSPENLASNPKQIPDNMSFTSTSALLLILKTLPNKTSSGLDNVPPIVLKHLPVKIIRDFAIIFNNCINNKFFPNIWKQAKIFPILKRGKPANKASSYRPISLTSAASKVFEIVINISLKKFSWEKKVVPANQFGFESRLSTTHAIHKCMTDISTHLHNNQVVGGCLIDLEKAFDSVWINGLLYILLRLDFPIDFIQLIWHMTLDRSFVLWNGTDTSSIVFHIVEGLTQGTVNSPALFNIYTHAVPTLFDMNTGNNSHSIAYADDFKILVADSKPSIVRRELESLVNRVVDHYLLWNLRVNPPKCETILYHKPLRFLNVNKRREIREFKINIRAGGSRYTIEHKKSVRYLGTQLDYLLRMHEHAMTQLTKARSAFRANSRLFFSRSLSTRAKVICYMLLIRPLLTYAFPVWWNLAASTMEKFRKFERSCLRACLHIYRAPNTKRFISNKIIYNRAGIPRIDSFAIKLSRDYYAGLSASGNDYLQGYAKVDGTASMDRARTGYTLPHDFTYFDRIGCIQDNNNVPLLYHTSRHPSDKTINPEKVLDPSRRKYATTLPDKDVRDKYKFKDKYWWLAQDRRLRDELRRRGRRFRPAPLPV